MFGRRIDLFKIFGFAIRIDLSWFIIAVLITWSLAEGWFPSSYEGLATSTYWWMGGAGALGLFGSVVLHELSHALVARRHGLSMKGITLFIFGGVAEMQDEPPSPRAEFMMAIAGPIASILIALACYGLYRGGTQAGLPVSITGVIEYLAMINGVLAVFNLVPAFPLDGGRVLRSALWRWRGNLRWATRITARMGSGFGIALILLGIMGVLSGNFVGGMWWFLIGMFLRGAAQMSYQQQLLRQALEGESISRFMKRDPITVPPDISIQELVDEYVYKYHFKMFPVVENGKLLGAINTRRLMDIPREEWPRQTVEAFTERPSPGNTVKSDMDAMNVLAKINRRGESRLMVVGEDGLVGVIALKDLLNFLALKIELEDGAG